MLQNVAVKNKITGAHLGNFETLSEVEVDQKAALKDRYGAGAYKLYWGTWKKRDGKRVFVPTSRSVYVYENGDTNRPQIEKIPQSVAGLQLDGNSAMVLKLIMERIDQNFQEIKDRLDSLTIQIEEGFYEDEEAPEAQSGTPAATPPADFMSDPRYAGLFGAIMLNANDPDKMIDALKEQIGKDPTIIQGLMSKMMGQQ